MTKRDFQPGEQALRIEVPELPIGFQDRIKGWTEKSLRSISGDFILFRRDKIYAYHLATVVDDHALGITHVVRGEDLIDATHQQIFLQNTLSFVSPQYAHTPLMMTSDGRKLSKSQGAPPVDPHHGGRVISYLLKYLGLPPPTDLTGAPSHEVLAWAISQWTLDKVKGIGAIVINDNTLPS